MREILVFAACAKCKERLMADVELDYRSRGGTGPAIVVEVPVHRCKKLKKEGRGK